MVSWVVSGAGRAGLLMAEQMANEAPKISGLCASFNEHLVNATQPCAAPGPDQRGGRPRQPGGDRHSHHPWRQRAERCAAFRRARHGQLCRKFDRHRLSGHGADPEGSAVSFSIPGTDAALFRIHAATGAVRFRDPPDFEAPQDSGLNGVYDLTVTASEGALSTALNVAITVTNVNGRASFGGLADSVTFAASSLAVAPRVLDGDVSFSAPDGTHAGRTLTVSGLLAGDQLGFAAIGGISVAGSSVLYKGTAFATLSIGPGSGPSRSASTSRSSRWPPPSPWPCWRMAATR
jgi:hypothetical protein